MPDAIINKLTRLLGRELTQEEQDRFLRCKEILQVSDDDAIWDLLAAMEYQRTYYEELPARIEESAQRVLHGISSTPQHGAPQIQNPGVGKFTNPSSMKAWFPWAVYALVAITIYGAINMWIGYCLGSGTIHPPAYLLKMPFGIVLGIASLCFGIGMAIKLGKDYAAEQSLAKQEIVITVGCIIFSIAICVLTIIY